MFQHQFEEIILSKLGQMDYQN